MGKTRRTKKFAAKKRLINPKDSRIKKNAEKIQEKEKKEKDLTKNKVNEGLQVKELYNIKLNPIEK
jgi:U3 small nucleolar RNA-associated protein 24